MKGGYWNEHSRKTKIRCVRAQCTVICVNYFLRSLAYFFSPLLLLWFPQSVYSIFFARHTHTHKWGYCIVLYCICINTYFTIFSAQFPSIVLNVKSLFRSWSVFECTCVCVWEAKSLARAVLKRRSCHVPFITDVINCLYILLCVFKWSVFV